MAPLKQSYVGVDAVLVKQFPRLQKRGPIEAPSSAPRSGAASTRFHAYKSVAPLKRSYLHGSLIYVVWFPRLQKRGPIEAKREQKEE